MREEEEAWRKRRRRRSRKREGSRAETQSGKQALRKQVIGKAGQVG